MAVQMQKDPVCGMDVDPEKAKAVRRTSDFQGKTYYFCADSCKQQFDKNPERYVRKPH